MFIVILGWLYVIAMVAITAPSVWLGLVIFVGGGVAPVLLWLYVAGSRIRRTRALQRDDAAPTAKGAPTDSPAHTSPPSSPE